MTAERSRFEPPESDAGHPFWEASRERRFVLPWCGTCGKAHWFPREVCPHCASLDLEWRDASGRGTVHACSVMPKPAMPTLADRVPYVVAIIELDEGPRMMSNVVGGEDGFDAGGEEAFDPFAVTVGHPVAIAWEPLSDGRHLPVFTLLGRSATMVGKAPSAR